MLDNELGDALGDDVEVGTIVEAEDAELTPELLVVNHQGTPEEEGLAVEDKLLLLLLLSVALLVG